MDNREKAQELIKVLEKPFSGKFLVELLEAELNRLDNPEPKKWEPRGGKHYVAADNIVKEGASIEPCRLAGREYPKLEEAGRAAPLHRKMDRLVNWLVEHCQEDIKFCTSWDSTSVRVHLHVPTPVIAEWQEGRDSGELKL